MSEAMRELAVLHERDLRERYPSLPGYAFPKSKFDDTKANGLTKCIVTFVKLKGGHIQRTNTTGIVRNGKWTRGGGTIGAADLTGIFNGVPFSIEVKIGRDKMSEAQTKQAESITRAGGKFFEARSFQEFRDWWSENFEPKPTTK